MRMLAPFWRIGGWFCNSCTSALWSPPNQELPEWILAWIDTVPAVPLRTVMSPERVSTSRSTGPLTWNERSKVPMTEAKPASEVAKTKTNVLTARFRIKKALVIAVQLHKQVFRMLGHAHLPQAKSCLFLLQYNLIAFL